MQKVILDSSAIARSIGRIVHQILEANEGADNIAIVGIQTRGVDIGKRIVAKISEMEKKEPPFGTVDITLYRDDFRELVEVPEAKDSKIDFDIKGIDIILVDDVLYTGRTVRSAIDVILDYGRPKSIQLAVLVDRGGRELPISANYVGKRVEVRPDEYVQVYTDETDKEDKVLLIKRKQ